MLYYVNSKGGCMSQKRIQQIEFRLQQIKRALLEIGPMRPGSLTRQYKDPQHHVGAYWQISYTRRMKSRTEYVRKEWVKEVRRQIATYKRFKRLIDQWCNVSRLFRSMFPRDLPGSFSDVFRCWVTNSSWVGARLG